MKSLLLLTTIFLSSFGLAHAQIKNANTETVKVYGDCGMCKSTIEKAAYQNKISKADWDEDTKMVVITYNSKKTSLDAVLKNIALAGYDNEKFLAPDETYNKLPNCCKYDREKKLTSKMQMKPDDHAGHSHAAVNKKGDSSVISATTQLQSVLEDYFLVKDALVKSDGAFASEKAAELLSALNAVKMETLKPEEHTAWMEWENKLKTYTKQISAIKDVTKQREHFSQLSAGMYNLAKAAKTDAPVYWQNCPMYNDGKGANWLSKDAAIKNPYYGSVMLSCGKNVETIK